MLSFFEKFLKVSVRFLFARDTGHYRVSFKVLLIFCNFQGSYDLWFAIRNIGFCFAFMQSTPRHKPCGSQSIMNNIILLLGTFQHFKVSSWTSFVANVLLTFVFAWLLICKLHFRFSNHLLLKFFSPPS